MSIVVVVRRTDFVMNLRYNSPMSPTRAASPAAPPKTVAMT